MRIAAYIIFQSDVWDFSILSKVICYRETFGGFASGKIMGTKETAAEFTSTQSFIIVIKV